MSVIVAEGVLRESPARTVCDNLSHRAYCGSQKSTQHPTPTPKFCALRQGGRAQSRAGFCAPQYRNFGFEICLLRLVGPCRAFNQILILLCPRPKYAQRRLTGQLGDQEQRNSLVKERHALEVRTRSLVSQLIALLKQDAGQQFQSRCACYFFAALLFLNLLGQASRLRVLNQPFQLSAGSAEEAAAMRNFISARFSCTEAGRPAEEQPAAAAGAAVPKNASVAALVERKTGLRLV